MVLVVSVVYYVDVWMSERELTTPLLLKPRRDGYTSGIAGSVQRNFSLSRSLPPCITRAG